MDYWNGISDEARQAKTGVPPKAHASLRLDWSAPFCASMSGSLVVRVALPDGGGTLDAPVRDATRPGCVTSELHPEVGGGLYISGFTPGDVDQATVRPACAPAPLTVSVVEAPQTVRAGQPANYVIQLAGPDGTRYR
jgi:hypothetical protein